MQTFLPTANWRESASILDYRRLGKQRVECKQILAAMGWMLDPDGQLIRREPSKGWRFHTCTQMWIGYEEALAQYQGVMIREWVARGYNNTMIIAAPSHYGFDLQPWHGDPAVHASHRSNLLRKDPEYYGQYGWAESPDLPYVWPTSGKTYPAELPAGAGAGLHDGLLAG